MNKEIIDTIQKHTTIEGNFESFYYKDRKYKLVGVENANLWQWYMSVIHKEDWNENPLEVAVVLNRSFFGDIKTLDMGMVSFDNDCIIPVWYGKDTKGFYSFDSIIDYSISKHWIDILLTLYKNQWLNIIYVNNWVIENKMQKVVNPFMSHKEIRTILLWIDTDKVELTDSKISTIEKVKKWVFLQKKYDSTELYQMIKKNNFVKVKLEKECLYSWMNIEIEDRGIYQVVSGGNSILEEVFRKIYYY